AQYLTYKTAEGWHDAYKMTVIGFQYPVVVGIYIAAMACLAMHLGHGVSSMFQTLGLNHPRYRPLITGAGPALAVLVFLGFTSIPIAVQLGIISLQGGA
ncbi:MAG: succinate:quinone oxidoreductase, partial [Myxococcota bacterium]